LLTFSASTQGIGSAFSAFIPTAASSRVAPSTPPMNRPHAASFATIGVSIVVGWTELTPDPVRRQFDGQGTHEAGDAVLGRGVVREVGNALSGRRTR